VTIPSDLTNLICRLTDDHMKKRNQPDKSIIVMDGASALHVLENGEGGELSVDAILNFMATEISIHPDALLDSRERQEFDEAAAERKQEKQSPAVEKTCHNHRN
jgi:ATP-dependent Clp protease ATP-binding subunit ClpA